MTETGYFNSGENKLAYSCTIPAGESEATGIIFIHAADGNRLGPHRMFVEFAGHFNSLGFPTFRFDLSGCGDSTGSVSGTDIANEVSDTIEAIHSFMTKANLENVILLGISRGAHVCYNVMAKHALPLGGLILLSMPISGNKAALNSFQNRLNEYLYKLKDPKHLRKLLSGKANFRQIGRTLTTTLRLKNRYAPTETNEFATKCPVLFIYGECDPLAAQSSRYYTTKCRENDVPYDCHYIADANHSFFHYKWKEQILDISVKWLEETNSKVLI